MAETERGPMFGGVLQNNPLLTFQKIWKSDKRSLKAVSLVGVAAGFLGVASSYLTFDYFLERIGNILIGLAILVWFYLETALSVDQEAEISAKIERAEQAVDEHPDKARPLWDLARSRLELYFERNLAQIKQIFWITMVVMTAGFIMVGYGIVQGFASNNMNASLLAAASGVLTEFIAATFLIIYRSTMSQAGSTSGR
ncbi:TRADD-N-associated membrane domain-containing protein [Rhizobium oryzicola]|uniref:Cyanobacterial TRADD-N associated 2 transmembrane domain-containing protein n=1 Tax=Rhizobium oryzicola TaxID=1232668 RepID=A0ABT8SZ14_9HYPH|nr:hypothetical protein [Rhizobium oryzicola]MDO1583601.1 hypothetical protein [Rhizobium oryzicola]